MNVRQNVTNNGACDCEWNRIRNDHNPSALCVIIGPVRHRSRVFEQQCFEHHLSPSSRTIPEMRVSVNG